MSVIALKENLSASSAKAGISQEELSNIVGISHQTYSAIESGKRAMPWNVYLSLVSFLHKVESTKGMINGLNVFPSSLFIKFNNEFPFSRL